jgi:hypothetical protein
MRRLFRDLLVEKIISLVAANSFPGVISGHRPIFDELTKDGEEASKISCKFIDRRKKGDIGDHL